MLTTLFFVITDFKTTEVIALNEIDAVAGGANDFFTFVGTTALGGAGQVRYEKLVAENITVVEGDVTGDAVADFRLELTGLIDLAAVNFAL